MKLTKKFLIDSIVSLKNLIAEISDVPHLEAAIKFMESIQGLENMSIPGLKIRLQLRTDTVEKYLSN